MTTVTIDRKDVDHAKQACAAYSIDVYFSECTDGSDKTLMIIPAQLPSHELWYLARYFQTNVMESRFKALL